MDCSSDLKNKQHNTQHTVQHNTQHTTRKQKLQTTLREANAAYLLLKEGIADLEKKHQELMFKSIKDLEAIVLLQNELLNL